jgi:hypothetical protein
LIPNKPKIGPRLRKEPSVTPENFGKIGKAFMLLHEAHALLDEVTNDYLDHELLGPPTLPIQQEVTAVSIKLSHLISKEVHDFYDQQSTSSR